jgi:serine/threonine protein kinase
MTRSLQRHGLIMHPMSRSTVRFRLIQEEMRISCASAIDLFILMPLSVGDKFGHYEVLSLLGQGGMGEVYRAKDTTLKREVALKVLPSAVLRDPERLSRFQREAEVLASLDHTNIGPIFGMAESAGARALVLALIEGPTLKDRISSGALQPEEAFRVARQIAEALEYAHDRGVIHRDLKPANVKITPEGNVKVLDFGLAKVLENEHPRMSGDESATLTMDQTSAGIILGTASYMSPEQAVGIPLDRRCDIFSFGALLFEMLTAKRAFGGASANEILASVVKDDPDWSRLPTGTPHEVANLIHRCLAKDRKQRLQAIGEARITLSNPWESPVEQNQRPSARAWIAAALMVIALPAVWFLRPAPPRKAITLEIAAPEGNPFASPETHFVLSPDGLYAAFIAQNQEGQFHVRLRTMDSGRVTRLPGTEDANRLFWSPDSRWIGFFAAGKLQKVSIDGGRPQIVCEGVRGLGSGTWNRSGVILFSEPPNPLQKVFASGGRPEPALPLDDSRHEILQVEPYFLPDGKHFLYLSHTSGTERGIVWASLDGKERRFLVQNMNSPATYAPNPAGGGTGWMIRNSGGRLLVQTLDPGKGKLEGEPVQLADPVPYGPNWSTSNTGIISFPRTIPIQKQMIWMSRDGSPLGVLGEIGIGAPSISPDQKTVAYTRQNALDSDIWLFDLARNVPRRFTFEPGRADSPVWTPDGSRIVYTTGREAFPRLVERPDVGTGPETILKQFEYFGGRVSTAIAKDGRWLSIAQNTGGDATAFFISRSERKLVPFPEPQVLWAALSPDSLWVVYATVASGGSEIFVRSSPREVGGMESAQKFQISTAGGTFPKWRSDGKEIFYISLDGKMMAAPVESGSGVFLPGTPKALFDAGRLFAQSAGVAVDFPGYDVTSDGQRFLLTTVASRTLDTPVTVILNWTALLKK